MVYNRATKARVLLRMQFMASLNDMDVPVSPTSPYPAPLKLGARPFAEETMFRAAHTYEQATDWHTRIAPAAQA